mgnify:CR=1 FL=1
MVKTRSKAVNLKKESRFKREHLYLILFVVIGMFFLSLINYSGNDITGSAVNIENSISGALDIFGQILSPLFEAVGSGKHGGVFSRIVIFIALFVILNSLSGITKLFKKRDSERGERSSYIIIGIISFAGAMAIPPTALTALGGAVLLGLYIFAVFGLIYSIWKSARGHENKMIYFLKGAFSLIGIVAMEAVNEEFNISSLTGLASSIANIVQAIGIATLGIFTFWYLFFQAIRGGQGESLPDMQRIKDVGGFYGGLGKNAVTGIGQGASAAGRGIADRWRNRKWFRKRQNPPQQQTGSGSPQQQQINISQLKTSIMRNNFMPMQVAHQNIIQQFNNQNPNLNQINNLLKVLRDNSLILIKSFGGYNANYDANQKIVGQIISLAKTIISSTDNMLKTNNVRQLNVAYKRGNNMQSWINNLGKAINNL